MSIKASTQLPNGSPPVSAIRIPKSTSAGFADVRVPAPVGVREPYIAGMADIVAGLLAILAGGCLLFAGQFVLRMVLTIWGVFAGFALGARALCETGG